MPQAFQLLSDTQGDNLSVQMFRGSGDAITVQDAAMSAGTAVLKSATAGFTAASVGTLAIVVGAAVSGGNLEANIIGFHSATEVVLSANASTTVASAEMTYGTDNAAAIQAAFLEPHCLIPNGRFLCSSAILLQDMPTFHLVGRGPSSIIIPGTNFATSNFLTLLGCNDGEIRHWTVDGRYFPDVSQEIINGDGSMANPLYGNIRVHHMNFLNCKPIVCGLGANLGNTAQDITYEKNYFYNCGSGSFLPNTIDTGSAGTKLRYKINRNRFVYITQPSSPSVGGVAIFMGLGTNYDFECVGNIIDDAPSDGIQVYNRPFATEPTTLMHFNISENIVRRSRWAGISIYGGSNVKVNDNHVIDPGIAMDNSTNVRRAGIAISTQQSGASNFGAVNIQLNDNHIIDDQSTHTMVYGIIESAPGGAGTANATGMLAHNIINGYSSHPISTYGSMAIQRHDIATLNWVFGESSPNAAVNAAPNHQIQSLLANLFLEDTALSAQSAGNFLLAKAFNAHFDGANWTSGADGANNGFSVLATTYGAPTTMRLYVVPRTGSTPQTISPATLEAFLQLIITSTGVIVPSLSASSGVLTDSNKMLISGAGTVGLTTEQISLSHTASTAITTGTTPSNGAQLLVILTNDSSNGNQIASWQSNMKNTDVDDVVGDANLKNFYLFAAYDSTNWWKIATALGVAP